MNVQKLINVIAKLQVGKDHKNQFGGYSYRNAEDILAGLKPLILAGILFLWLLVGGGAINGAAGLLADGAALRLVW